MSKSSSLSLSLTLQELAAMKQVLISMLAKQGDTSNPLGAEKSVAASAGSWGGVQTQAKRLGRTIEEESPKQPKPTVFVSVWLQPLNPNLSAAAPLCGG